jgi:hypothetical protein
MCSWLSHLPKHPKRQTLQEFAPELCHEVLLDVPSRAQQPEADAKDVSASVSASRVPARAEGEDRSVACGRAAAAGASCSATPADISHPLGPAPPPPAAEGSSSAPLPSGRQAHLPHPASALFRGALQAEAEPHCGNEDRLNRQSFTAWLEEESPTGSPGGSPCSAPLDRQHHLVKQGCRR